MARTVPLHIAGEEQPRLLRFDANALSLVENTTGRGLQLLLLEGRAISTIRVLLWAGLKDQLPTRKRAEWTLDKAGTLLQEHMDAGGKLETIAAAIGEAITASGLLPDDEDEPAKGGEPKGGSGSAPAGPPS